MVSIRLHVLRFAIASIGPILVTSCGEARAPTAPNIASASFSQTTSSAATRTHFVAGPFNFEGPLYLSCINETVTLHNLGVVLTYDVVTTSNGNIIYRARIDWPEHLFYVERQNGVKYYQPDNAKSIYHELSGPVNFFTITDAWQLRAADGSMLKFQTHTRVQLDDAGNVIDVKITGSCP